MRVMFSLEPNVGDELSLAPNGGRIWVDEKSRHRIHFLAVGVGHILVEKIGMRIV